MLKTLQIFSLALSAALLQGCDRAAENTAPSSSSDDKIMQELASEPVKAFAKTADDPADIQALLDYDQRFTAVSDDMEDELMQMKESGTLTEEFAAERKQGNIQSALSMLRELDLKTQQGRYIQGLMYQYWENQRKLHEMPASETQASSNVQGLGQFLHAQEQLAHWQAQYPALNAASEPK